MFTTYRDATAQEHVLSTVAYIEVRTREGDISIGTAFHIGFGYFVTARHVIEGHEILKVGQSDLSAKTSINPDGGRQERTTHPAFEQSGSEIRRFEHPEADVALIQLTGNLGPRGPAGSLQPAMELADHADILTEGELLMTNVRVFGYPPIPRALYSHPPLVTSPGEISAVVTNIADRRRHFIISGLARGGFSGGPVFLVDNPRVEAAAGPGLRDNSSTAIGVVVESLERRASSDSSSADARNFEPGFMDAISIETVHEVIAHHKLPVRLPHWTEKGFLPG